MPDDQQDNVYTGYLGAGHGLPGGHTLPRSLGYERSAIHPAGGTSGAALQDRGTVATSWLVAGSLDSWSPRRHVPPAA